MTYQNPVNTTDLGASTVQDSALELFQIAALLLGEEQEAVGVVEDAVAKADSDPCCDPLAAHREARERVIVESLKRLGKLSGGGLDAGLVTGGVSQSSCIEGDDLSSAGLTPEQLGGMLEGTGRARLRQWLDRLSPAMRAVFVLRAVVGRSNDGAAEALRASGSTGAEGWTATAVSQVFRQALCSIASSLLHSSEEAVSGNSSAKA